MSDEAFARRFYSTARSCCRSGCRCSRSVTSSRARSCTRSALSSTSCRSWSSRTRARGPPDRPLSARGAVRVCGAVAARAAEPRTRPAGLRRTLTETAGGVEGLDPDYSVEMPGRLAKLEGAISKQRTVKFDYWSISRDDHSERTLNPYALDNDRGKWYVVGRDLDRDVLHLPRLAHRRRHQVCNTARAGLPASDRLRRRRPAPGRPDWLIGDVVGEARIEVRGDTAWWVQRAYGSIGHIEDGRLRHRVLVRRRARLLGAAPGRPRGADRAGRAAARGGLLLRRVRDRHEVKTQEAGMRETPLRGVEDVDEHPAGLVVPERSPSSRACSRTSWPPAGRRRTRRFRRRAARALPSIPADGSRGSCPS